MAELSNISEKLRNVLKDLEQVTDDIETIQAQAQSVSNDDFLTRETAAPKNDN